MGRTASPAIPGTNPNDTAADAGDSLLDTSGDDGADQQAARAAQVQQLGLVRASATAAPDLSTMQALLDSQAKEMADLKAMINRIGTNQANSQGEPVKLPTMAETMAKKPTVPVLTVEGWFVPLVHPTARIVEA